MQRLLIATIITCAFSVPAQAAVTFGLSTGLASAKGKDSDHVYSSFTPLTLFIGFIGDSNYSFELGYSQLADIEEKTITEEINISLDGMFLAGRYFLQFSDTGFGYVKLGIHHWSGHAKINNISSNNVTASGKADGFTPLIGFGSDFVFPGADFALRVEYEHLIEIGDGIFDNTVDDASTSSFVTDGTFVSEGYSYDRFSIGFLVAF